MRPAFEAAQLTAHAGLFVGIRPAADDIDPGLLPQQLNQPHPAAGILDDDEIHLPLRGERGNLLAHLDQTPMSAGDMEKMEGLLLDADNRDRGVVVVSSSFSGRDHSSAQPAEKCRALVRDHNARARPL